MRRIACGMYVAAVVCLTAADEPPTPETEVSDLSLSHLCDDPFGEQLDKRVRRLRELTDADLRVEFAKSTRVRPELLAEVIRRGGRSWQVELERRYAAKRNSRRKLKEKQDQLLTMNEELLLLSALHVMDERPMPVGIAIADEKTIDVVWPEMPVIEVVFVNQHPDREPVVWEEGGNYRHGRRESLGFDVTDDEGQVMPVVVPRFMRGGMIHHVELKPGEQWRQQVPLASFCKNLVPARYHVRATYAFGYYLGCIQDKSNVFTIRSEPLLLTVRPREVTVTPAQQNAVREQLTQLELSEPFPNAPPANTVSRLLDLFSGRPPAPLRFIDGRYDPEKHNAFIAPESPAGQLLQLGWIAVPAMIEALEDEQVHSDKRGWLLGLLYSITGFNDPRSTDVPAGVLSTYEYKTARGWQVAHSKGSGSFGLGGDGRVERTVNLENQLRFAKRWTACREFLRVNTVQDGKE